MTLTFSDLVSRGSLVLSDGYRTKAAELGTSGIPILRVAEVGDGYLLPRSGERIRDEYLAKIGVKLSEPGDVVLTTKGTVGRRAVVQADEGGLAYSPQVCFFRVKDDSIDPRWLYYWLGGRDFWVQAAGVSAQTDMAAYISLRDLRRVEVSLPEVDEQRAIAATLGALDDKIESNRRAAALTEELVRARFDAAFDVNHRADGLAISDLVRVNATRKLPRGEQATYVGMADLPEFSAQIESWKQKSAGSGQRFVSGDVLMARITPCLENGKTAIVDMMQDGEVGWGSTEIIVLSPNGDISTPWIYAFARNDAVRTWAIGRMTGSSGRQRFRADEFDSYRIASPSEEKLEAFNKFAIPLFERMSVMRDESRRLIALRDALLPELLSGRVRATSEELVSA